LIIFNYYSRENNIYFVSLISSGLRREDLLLQVITDITKEGIASLILRDHKITTSLQDNTARPRTSVDVTFAHSRQHNSGRATSFLPISIRSRFFCVDRSHVGICKATYHCGIVLLTQINCVRRIVQGRVCRYKIQRCEAPQRAVLLADPRRM